MAFAADGENLLLGRGAVFFRRNEAAGVGAGFRFLGNVTRLELSMEDEEIRKYSSVEAAAPLIKRVVSRRTPRVTLTLDEMNPDNMTLALMGTKSSYTQTATPITNEAFTDVLKGGVIRTLRRGISAVTVTGPGGTPTYTNVTDYVIEDAEAGLIRITTGGAIADGAELEVDYTPTAISAPGLVTVRGGVSTVIEGALLFVGAPAEGPKFQLDVWKMSLSSQAVVSLIQAEDEFASAELTGEILSDAALHPSDPYFLLTQIAA